jgi:hypothetical protein
MFGWLWKNRAYRITIFDSKYACWRRENWREIVKWGETTFDKDNYSCDIMLSSGMVSKVVLKLKRKEDYMLLALTWLADYQ